MRLEEKVLELLLDKKLHISFVESCTGGMLASRLISVSGASGTIEQSYITYSNSAKEKMVGVSEETLKEAGAVSEACAMEMAFGGARVSQSDICVSVTGVAGPASEENKPVGLVYIGIYYKGMVRVIENRFSGDREQIRQSACDSAFENIIAILKA